MGITSSGTTLKIAYHFVDADFEDTLKVRIDGLGKDAIETELIDVQARGMPVVKDLRMAKAVRRGTITSKGAQW
jgi:hypothetical protein